MNRQKSSECVLQYLFGKEITGHTMDDVLPMSMKMLTISKKNAKTALEKAEKVALHLKTLDAKINETSTNYKIERIGGVDRLILQMALYDQIFEKVSLKDAINEALRLSKKFSTPSASKFVHAVLDNAGKSGMAYAEVAKASESRMIDDSLREDSLTENDLREVNPEDLSRRVAIPKKVEETTLEDEAAAIAAMFNQAPPKKTEVESEDLSEKKGQDKGDFSKNLRKKIDQILKKVSPK